MSASDSEYEEEEILVFADFKNNLILEELEAANTSVKIIGIDSDNPIAEVNGNIFKDNMFVVEQIKPMWADVLLHIIQSGAAEQFTKFIQTAAKTYLLYFLCTISCVCSIANFSCLSYVEQYLIPFRYLSPAFQIVGKYDFSMGTHVFFEEDEEPIPVDAIYEKHAKRTFKYFDKTNKVLNFSRIFVEPESNSKEPTAQDDSSDITDGKNPLQVDLTYEEALQQLISKDSN